MIADGSADQNLVAGSNGTRPQISTPGIGRPIPAVVMYMESALPCSTTFVSPPAITTPAFCAAVGHGANFGFQNLRRQARFQDVGDYHRLSRARRKQRDRSPFR